MGTLSERFKMHDLNEKAHRVYDDASSRASQFASRAKDVVSSRASSMSSMMREHPMATVAIGLCAGFLIALATRRR